MPYRGVFYRGQSKRIVAGWSAQIHRGGKRRHSPVFDSEIAAAQWVSEQVGNPSALDLKKDSSEEPVVKAARRLTGKTRTCPVSSRLRSKGPPRRLADLLRQEQSLRVKAEARVREFEEELAQGKAEVQFARELAVVARELAEKLPDIVIE